MHWRYSMLAFALLLVLSQLVAGAAESEGNITGIWVGALKSKGVEIRLVFRVSGTAEGGLTAFMDVPDQGVQGLSADGVSFQEQVLRIQLRAAGIVYEGKLRGDEEAIEGFFSQAGTRMPLTLQKTTEAPKPPLRPQEPRGPLPYVQEEVSYRNQGADIQLEGTLTLPQGDGPFPAVILITGSGPQDRNETLFGHRPFLVLADYLTRRGIAVLRADDRCLPKGPASDGGMKNWFRHTTADFAEDALAGAAYLKTRNEISSVQIGLLGHSEGAIVSAMVAGKSSDVAFVVMLAGPGQNLKDVLSRQCDLLLEASGATDGVREWQREFLRLQFEVLEKQVNDRAARTELAEVRAELMSKLSDEERRWLESLGWTQEAEVYQWASPWWRYLTAIEPQDLLKKVHCPLLALIGEKDLQVPAKENLRLIRRALEDGGNKDFLVMEVPGVNHLFQTCETGALSEYPKIEETFSPAALQMIGDWILRHAQNR